MSLVSGSRIGFSWKELYINQVHFSTQETGFPADPPDLWYNSLSTPISPTEGKPHGPNPGSIEPAQIRTCLSGRAALRSEKQAILQAAMRAPTAGNMMLYSIIDVENQALKDRLAVTCDDQPFIAKAPFVLLFVADYQRWYDYYLVCGVERLCLERDIPLRTPQEGDLAAGLFRCPHRSPNRRDRSGSARDRLMLYRRYYREVGGAPKAVQAAPVHTPDYVGLFWPAYSQPGSPSP